MKTRHPILLALLLLGTLHADVDSTFFHPAASAFIHGDANTASNKVAQGLQQYPNDPKLQRLKELLEQQQENEDQQDQQDNQNQQDPSNDPQDPQQQQNDSENNPNNDPSDPSDSPPNTTPPPQAEEMTPEEAQQLLDAMRQDEENKRSQLRPIMGAPVRVEKDW